MAKKQAPAAVPPTGPDAAPAGKGRLKLIILIVVAMLVAVGLSVGGTLYFMSKGDDLEGSKTQEAATTVSGKQPAIYRCSCRRSWSTSTTRGGSGTCR